LLFFSFLFRCPLLTSYFTWPVPFTQILSSSTFSDWAGLLGIAKSIHAPYLTKSNGGTPSRNWAPVWSADDRCALSCDFIKTWYFIVQITNRYIYHDPFERRYFGRFDTINGFVVFRNESSTKSSSHIKPVANDSLLTANKAKIAVLHNFEKYPTDDDTLPVKFKPNSS
jgi:hypothetical protein